MDMTHPTSSHRYSPGDVPAAHSGHSPQHGLCALSPLHPQLQLSTSRTTSVAHSSAASSIAVAFADSASSKDQTPTSTHMGFESNTSGMPHWAQYHLRFDRDNDDSLFEQPPGLAPDYTALTGHIPHGLPYVDSYNLAYPTFSTADRCPRSNPDAIRFTSYRDEMQESFPPSAYLIEPQRAQDVKASPERNASGLQLHMHLNETFDLTWESQIKSEGSTVYSMTSESETNTRCSTPHDEPPWPPVDFKGNISGDDSAVDKEQPYAQLIYKALLGARGHTMILRDIYNWFVENTDKALDKETKGWQNSIRHNLSMNGAFEKIEQPGENTPKGFMWRLTDEAIREGVKSTTRYRSKHTSKRSYRSGKPQPQRQASGAKGGQAAKRSARLRRSRMNGRYNPRSEPYMARSTSQVAYSPAFENPDMPVSFPASPFFSSESDFGTSMDSDGYAGPYQGQPLQLRSFTAPQHNSLQVDSAFLVPPADIQESFFYESTPSNMSSPLADELTTPQSLRGWNIVPNGGTNDPFVFEDYSSNYRENLP